jgi:hypothetical protein
MTNESQTGSIDSADPPLRPDFAYRILRRAQEEQSWRIRRRLLVAAGVATALGVLIIYLGYPRHPRPFAPRHGDRAAIAAAASGDFPRTDFEWMGQSDSQESVGGYFFPDLRPLAEFDAAYDPAETSNSYENAS